MMKIHFISILILFSSINICFAQDGTITIDSSQEIRNLVTKKINYNTTNKSLDNFQIQLFYGSENGAEKTLNKFRKLFPTTISKLEFDSPNWKVKVGRYKTRLKADKNLQEFIIIFGDAIVIETKK